MKPNLFICLTPLQALIAQRLIQQHGAPADLLMACYAQADNEKFRYYFRQTAALCRRADYVLIPQGRWQREWVLPRLMKKLDTRYALVFAASIDNPCVQYPLSHLLFDALNTFDDGTANLYPTSILYHNTPQSFKRRVINRLQGIRYQTEDLRRLSQRHYTLYPALPNIVAHTEPLSLWQTNISGSPKRQTRKIWLGQPLLAHPADNAVLSKKFLQQLDIQEYFPHPRETQLPDNISVINTPLIFEDWLLHTILHAPETQFELYHFASSAALNVANFPNTKPIAIRPNMPVFRQPEFTYLYNLMKQLNISILDLPQ